MSGHHYDDWETREERVTRLARSNANKLKQEQQSKSTVKGWINEKLDKMSPADLEFMYKMSVQVPEMRAFFKVFKELQK